MSKSTKVVTVGMVLVMLVYRFIMPSLTDHHGHNLLFRASAEVAAFGFALDQFKIGCGRYPTTEEGLVALMERPSSILATQWCQFLNSPKGTNILRDPWGHPYIYKCPGTHNTIGFDVSSGGPNARPGTAEEIGNWAQAK